MTETTDTAPDATVIAAKQAVGHYEVGRQGTRDEATVHDGMNGLIVWGVRSVVSAP